MLIRGAILRRALPAILILGLGGCEMLVRGDVSPIHCTVEGAKGLPDCPTGQVCTAGTCVDKELIDPKLGTACVDDTQCAAGDFCFDPAAMGLPGKPRCTRSCCSSRGCDPEAGFVCYSPPATGVSLCMDAASIHREEPGEGPAGAPCAKGSECRSGLCDSGACLDLCCSDAGCAATGDTCQLGARGGATAFTCAPPPSDKKAFYDGCVQDSECASGLCADFGSGVSRCAAPCCSSDSCSGLTGQGQIMPVACTYVSHGGSLVRACTTPLAVMKLGAVGQPCLRDDDCRSHSCERPDDNKPGICTDACCADALCGEPGNFECRPAPIEGSFALRCEHK